MPKLPVILTAFVNSHDAVYSAHLGQEYNRLQEILVPLSYLKHISLLSAKTEKLVSTLIQFKQELLILHFGGHADGSKLHFNDAGGHLVGLAEILSLHPQLKLVFLNGCNTQAQAVPYLEAGVPAVIVTTCSVVDGQAIQFAEVFYTALAMGGTLEEAFVRATDAAKLQRGEYHQEEIILHHGVRLRQEQIIEMPWRLYAHNEANLNWKLADMWVELPNRDLVRKDRQSSPASSPRGTNYLLAIAINEYQHCSKLNNAVRDVEAFIKLITTRYHFDPAHVTFIKDAEATKKRIESTFDDLIDVIEPQDNLIVYFSGHGRHHERRGGFWVPVEAGKGEKDWSDYISNDTIKSYLSKIKSFHTFLIADSCFSGSLFIDKSKEKFSGDRRDTEPSRWGLTSGKKEIVSDGRPGHHSPFATALLDVLRKADQPPGVMRICDLVLEKVAANAEQTPMGSPLQVPGHQGGQMVLYFREDEEAAWQIAQQTGTRQSYSDFCDKYPHGKYIDEALAKLDSREEKEIWEQVPKYREAALRRFIRENPTSPYVAEAKRLVEKLQDIKASAKLPVPPKSSDHMVLVKGGTFQMAEGNKTHPVTLSDFFIAKHQLTFKEYDAFCKATGRDLPSDMGWGRGKRPAINVSWFDAVDYCNWRSQKEGLGQVYQIKQQQISPNWQANGYRLPTKAEWKYAAQGGQQGNGFEYAGSNNPDEVAWHRDNSSGKTQPVGQKEANELGLYDFSGNVWEWCWDWYDANSTKATDDPKGPDTGSLRFLLGGSWNGDKIYSQIGFSNIANPDFRYEDVGFRLAKRQ